MNAICVGALAAVQGLAVAVIDEGAVRHVRAFGKRGVARGETRMPWRWE